MQINHVQYSFNLISTNQLRPAPVSLKKWKAGKGLIHFFNSIIGWPGRLKKLGPNGAISVVLSHNINYSNAPNTYDLAVLGYALGLISAPFRDLILLPFSGQKRIPLRACFCVKPKGNKGFEHCREDRKGAVSGPEMVPLFISIPDTELDHFLDTLLWVHGFLRCMDFACFTFSRQLTFSIQFRPVPRA